MPPVIALVSIAFAPYALWRGIGSHLGHQHLKRSVAALLLLGSLLMVAGAAVDLRPSGDLDRVALVALIGWSLAAVGMLVALLPARTKSTPAHDSRRTEVSKGPTD
ncbi:MAG TPA: hypothetical protein VKA53_00710 [Thermoanaerobaculia bacterium]|nr:hypothetical protein [Thermoanaerobaculia bacterium]